MMAANIVGLQISEKKRTNTCSWRISKAAKNKKKYSTVENLKGMKIEEIRLRGLINKRYEEKAEIDFKFAKSNRCMYGIIKSKHQLWAVKKRMYETIFRPILLYGSETRVLTKKKNKIKSKYGRKKIKENGCDRWAI